MFFKGVEEGSAVSNLFVIQKVDYHGCYALVFLLTPTTLRWSTLSSPAVERG